MDIIYIGYVWPTSMLARRGRKKNRRCVAYDISLCIFPVENEISLLSKFQLTKYLHWFRLWFIPC